MITDVEDYFARGCGRCGRFGTPDCSARLWAGALAALRAACLEAGLAECAKWGHPCYVHAGRNVALLGAFRGEARLSLFEAGLLADPDGVLERQGPNSRHADAVRVRVRSEAEAAAKAPALRALLRQAMSNAERGLRAPREAGEAELPDELVEALDADAELAEAFHALTPGRRRGYAIHLRQAKAPATRVARIERLRPRILAGKGPLER